MPQPPVVTFTVFHFRPRRRAWAFAQMGLARPLLRGVPGLRFWKMMGAGRGLGFTIRPDWGRYALLAVWNDTSSMKIFFSDSQFIRRYRHASDHLCTLTLQPLTTHGSWDGHTPFLPALNHKPEPHQPIAVLTRATIRFARLRQFWGHVPRVHQEVAEAAGLLASIGVGEAPFFRQGTVSVWENAEAMKQLAYRQPEHQKAIERTRKESWYREELFTRFVVIDGMEQLPL